MLICYLRELLRSAAKISSGLNSSLSFGVLIATVLLLTNLCETTEEINALTQHLCTLLFLKTEIDEKLCSLFEHQKLFVDLRFSKLKMVSFQL